MLSLGLDIGCISVKLACVGGPEDREALERISRGGSGFHFVNNGAEGKHVLIAPYRRLLGHPLATAAELLEAFLKETQGLPVGGIRTTGRGGRAAAERVGGTFENEFKAIARAAEVLCPQASTIFEMGGETSKYIRLERDASGRFGITDYEVNGDCAAGTGSFMDQQAKRMRYAPEEIGDIVCTATSCATIAGRCSVFAKSDMIHAQQKGFTPEAILRGLCLAVIRNYKGAITKGKKIGLPVALIGGLAANKGVTASVKELFALKDGELVVPEAHAFFGAIGAALLEAENGSRPTGTSSLTREEIAILRQAGERKTVDFPTFEPLSLEKVSLWRDRLTPHPLPQGENGIPAYLGIDVGSVSTNLVVTDQEGQVLKEIYLRTEGRPIEVVGAGLEEISREMGDRLVIRGAGTTGSGRELIGELVGADVVVNEITAHKEGAGFVSRVLGGSPVDTIFEVGGQDSKYISIREGIVVDFAMNEACAAGTGSFLEEQAEKLGMNIREEFAHLALSSSHPARLGERCTVFMEQDLNAFQHRGAERGDLAAGLAYSVALNYLNRVVRERKIGEVIYFQGGTAYNDAVAAAFSMILGKPVIVPPYNGVIGALGMALIARDRREGRTAPSRFRGYEIGKVPYTLKEFVCKACGNICEMQEFTIEGQKTYWGDKCSDKFRKKAKTQRQPAIPDLVAQREAWLLENYDPPSEGASLERTVGIPRAMYFFEKFPFWKAFFESLGWRILLSETTNRKIVSHGAELTVAEPCFPVKVAHGHTFALLQKDIPFVFLPNVMDEAGSPDATFSHLCPWGQTLPWVLRAVQGFEKDLPRFLSPTLHFRLGPAKIKKEIQVLARPLGASRRALERAIKAGYEAQERFQDRLISAGREALEILRRTGERGIVALGRPYNLYDRDLIVDVLGKLRNYYGANLIPLDFLPLEDLDIRDINSNMFWTYGRKLIAAAKRVGQEPALELLYITNFKCGPDSYLKHFVPAAARKPILILQFDEHNNDAGVMTRCEAFLDSKGMM